MEKMEKSTTYASRLLRTPETQRSRFRMHRERLTAIKREPQAGKRFLNSLRVFFTDCWLDIVTIVIIIACAGGVSLELFVTGRH